METPRERQVRETLEDMALADQVVAEVDRQMEELPPWHGDREVRECELCTTRFTVLAGTRARGKWARLCPSCLQDEL